MHHSQARHSMLQPQSLYRPYITKLYNPGDCRAIPHQTMVAFSIFYPLFRRIGVIILLAEEEVTLRRILN
jgi:hypothetical protein